MSDWENYVRQMVDRAQNASREIAVAAGEVKNDWLLRAAKSIRAETPALMDANRKDIDQSPQYGLTDAAVDRLRLSEQRLDGIAASLEKIALLPDPVGEIYESTIRPNGLLVTRVRVPLGVVFFIYESRPNVTVDAAALCMKSGNAVILRGGKEAFHSNRAFARLLCEALTDAGLPKETVQFVETTDRDVVGYFLRLRAGIDVTIPRGGKSLIERVAAEAAMPVIKHFDGNCHVYVDRGADLEMAEEIVVDSKCQRPGVCNAAESLLVHAEIAAAFLPRIAARLRERGVELRVCEKSARYIENAKTATNDDYRSEFLDLILSVKIVDDDLHAIEHIREFSSRHTDAIVTNDLAVSRRFTAAVDSAAVFVNASTRFHDGEQFGLGAEIGISTDKFHARGPCGLRELTSYKYVVHGDGQIIAQAD